MRWIHWSHQAQFSISVLLNCLLWTINSLQNSTGPCTTLGVAQSRMISEMIFSCFLFYYNSLSITLTYSWLLCCLFHWENSATQKRTLLPCLPIHQQLFPYTLISLFSLWFDCLQSNCQPLPLCPFLPIQGCINSSSPLPLLHLQLSALY